MFLRIDQSFFDVKNILSMMYEKFWAQIQDFKIEAKAVEDILEKSKLDEIYWLIRTNKITQKDLKLKTIEIIKENMQGLLHQDMSYLYYILNPYEAPPKNDINWEMASTCEEDKAFGKNLIIFNVLQNLFNYQYSSFLEDYFTSFPSSLNTVLLYLFLS